MKSITVRFEDNDNELLREQAEEIGISLSEYIRRLCLCALETDEEKPDVQAIRKEAETEYNVRLEKEKAFIKQQERKRYNKLLTEHTSSIYTQAYADTDQKIEQIRIEMENENARRYDIEVKKIRKESERMIANEKRAYEAALKAENVRINQGYQKQLSENIETIIGRYNHIIKEHCDPAQKREMTRQLNIRDQAFRETLHEIVFEGVWGDKFFGGHYAEKEQKTWNKTLKRIQTLDNEGVKIEAERVKKLLVAK